MGKKEIEAVKSFKDISKEIISTFIDTIDLDSIQSAAQLILVAEKEGKRLHITGIGKPAYVAQYTASLFSSTGTPTYFLHGTEAVHGSCGQLVAGDVVIAISNSGETEELKAAVTAAKKNRCTIIGVSGNENSWLSKEAAVFLYAGIEKEGGPLNRAPRNSILAEIYILQVLSIYLQVNCNLTPKEYVLRHPGGKLGELRKEEIERE